MASTLPPFLTVASDEHIGTATQVFAKSSVGASSSFWYGPREGSAKPDVVVLFRPGEQQSEFFDVVRSTSVVGNPGILSVYLAFLQEWHDHFKGNLAIVAIGNLGQGGERYLSDDSVGLKAQVQHTVDLLDAAKDYYPKSKIILSGHSMGSWLSLQVCLSPFGSFHYCRLSLGSLR